MIALDLETFWSRRYSVATLGLDRYVMHPSFKVTLASLYSPDFQWVGKPEDLPVDRLNGQEVCAHNAEFDSVCSRMAIFNGTMPDFTPSRWVCTADMAAFHQFPRALAGACKELFGIEVDKSARNAMQSLSVDEIQANPTFVEYALLDAKLSYDVHEALKVGFPEREALLSELGRKIGSRGMPLDGPFTQTQIDLLWKIMADCEKALPWVGGENSAAVTSTVALTDACKLDNVPPPPATSETDVETMKWKATYPKQAAWLDAMSRWRKANKQSESLTGLLLRKRPDSRVSVRFKYCGAQHTKRWSGTGGLNFHGIPREDVEGTSFKKCLKASPGKVIVSADFSQIEPRILHWIAGDLDFLSLVRGGIDLYEAHGRASGLYQEDEPMKDLAPELRHLCKARVLGLGYGCGVKKFGQVASALTGGKLNLSASEARSQVFNYRKQNPKIPELWKRIENYVRDRIPETDGEVVTVETRANTPIRYFDVEDKEGELSGRTIKGGPRKKLYGGLLTENLIQATARDVFAEALLKAEAAGLEILLHVHDSLTVEVEESRGSEALELITSTLSSPPVWAEGLPLAAEGEVKKHY